MKLPKLLMTLALLALLAVLLWTIIDIPQTASAQGISAQETVGTTFTYQGRLLDNGQPVDDTCDFAFTLYDAASGGNIVGNASTAADVNDGYFSALVDFGSGVFEGQARWMAVQVRCPTGSGSHTSLGGRIPLTPAPYAQSLRPGAVISGSEISTFSVKNSFQAALFPAAAIAGYATGNSGKNRGVSGLSDSDTGVGVYGEATSLSSEIGKTSYGGKFIAKGEEDIAVYGEHDPAGTTSSGYGVYGKSSSAYGYGIYSDGNAHVQGKLTWEPASSYISIPAAAFIPQLDIDDPPNWEGYPSYLNFGERLIIFPFTGAPVYNYVAPVQLPHGAIVRLMTTHFHDSNLGDDVKVSLYRKGRQQMAYTESSGQPGTDHEYDDTISYDTVDNLNYTYYLSATLTSTYNLELHNVVIGYEIAQPY